MKNHARQGGFTLVEMMVAIVLGILVVSAVSAFAVSSLRAYADNMRSSRMTRDLRTGMTLAVRELRRAGYDSAAVTRTLTQSDPTMFGAMTVSGECVIYRYDRRLGGEADGPVAAETRGIRRNSASNALEIASSGADCDSAAGWVPISDPKSLAVTQFTPKLVESAYCQPIGSIQDPTTGKFTFTYGKGRVRTLQLCLKGRDARDASITRFVTDSVRVRAESPQFLTKIVDTAADAKCSVVESSGLYVNGVQDTATTLPEAPNALATACAQ